MDTRKPPSSPPQEPAFLDAVRRSAQARAEAVGFPARGQDTWVYLDLPRLAEAEKTFKDTTAPAPAATPQASSDAATVKAALGGVHLTLLDGFCVQKPQSSGRLEFLSLSDALASGSAVLQEFLAGGAATDDDYFYGINTMKFRDGAYVRAPAGVDASEKTLHIWLDASRRAEPFRFFPRVLVVAEKGSACRIALHSGSGFGPYFMNAAVEVHAAEGARVSVVHVAESGAKSYEFTAGRIFAAAGAHVDWTAVSLGDGLCRNDIRAELSGKEASVVLNGLSVLAGSAEVHNHTVVRHAALATVSRQIFKDILAGHSHSEYSGLVHVHKAGQKSDSNQLNRNLLLSDDARTHSRPQLKIDADDVKCSHGSATGQLAPQELFYLRSRGLNAEEARTVLIKGFAEEVVDMVADARLRADIRHRVNRDLQIVAGLKAEQL